MFTIYQVINKTNGKSYIGYNSSCNERKRFNEHVQASKRGSVLPLHAAIRKYGKQNFSLKILEMGENQEYGLKIAEPTYIYWMKPEYNICSGGEGTPGRVWSEESKLKSSLSQKGRKLSEAHRKALCVPKKNLIRKEKSTRRTKEESNKLKSESRKRFISSHPEEVKRLQTLGIGNKFRLGASVSVETRNLMSLAHRGIPEPKALCPYCNKTGGVGAMSRWHFGKCKHKND